MFKRFAWAAAIALSFCLVSCSDDDNDKIAVGDSCDVDKFKKRCVGDLVIRCDDGKVYIASDCGRYGEVCRSDMEGHAVCVDKN